MSEATSRPAANNGKFGSVILVLTVLYLLTFVFEGGIRYTLSLANAGSLLYARDLIPIFGIFALFWGWVIHQYRPNVFLIVSGVLAFHLVIGTFYLGTFFQQMFGAKIFLPFLLGIVFITVSSVTVDSIKTLTGVLIVVCSSAIVANNFIHFPWEGAEFETIFGVSQQSRQWYAQGVRRLSGLSRASFDAASVLLATSLLALTCFKSTVARVALWSFALLGIILTTSKGAVVAMVVLGLIAIFSRLGQREQLLRITLVMVALLVVVLPIVSLAFDVTQRGVPTNLRWLISSFADRMEWMWPRAFNMWAEHGNLILGRGLGGIGAPQAYGEWRMLNAADNIFVYVTVTFGSLGWLYAMALLIKLVSWSGECDVQRFLVYGFTISVLVYGLTVGVFEQPILSFGLGCVTAWVFKERQPATAEATKPC